jgi:hypothetical protein
VGNHQVPHRQDSRAATQPISTFHAFVNPWLFDHDSELPRLCLPGARVGGVPVETLRRESEGHPGRVHRAVAPEGCSLADSLSHVYQLTEYIRMSCRCLVWFGGQQGEHPTVTCSVTPPYPGPPGLSDPQLKSAARHLRTRYVRVS